MSDMIREHDAIIIIITQVTNVDRKKELNYLLAQHKDIVITADIDLNSRKGLNTNENPLWIQIKNCGKGMYLASKIYRKFKPWITMGLMKNIYWFEFPEEIQKMEKWTKKEEKTWGDKFL